MLEQKTIISCDWGTSSFRLKIVRIEDGVQLAEIATKDGISVVYNNWLATQRNQIIGKTAYFLQVLNQKITDLLHFLKDVYKPEAVIISGMASSSIGLVELPYAATPFSLEGKQVVYEKLETDIQTAYPLWIVSGLRHENEVMRGEETQLIGIAEMMNNLSRDEFTCIIPGTHSKHIEVKEGVVKSFQTYMTGELFQLLCRHSVLSNSVSDRTETDNLRGSELAAFARGVKKSINSNLLNTVFEVRTNHLFNCLTKTENSCYLSGLLIGSELQELKQKPLNQLVLACGESTFRYYKEAVKILALDTVSLILRPEQVDAAAMQGQLKLFTTIFQQHMYENN